MPRDFSGCGTFRPGPYYSWRKMILGKFYSVRCGEPTENTPGLGLPKEQWTKIGSYQPAKDYFAGLLDELKPRKTRPVESLAASVNGLTFADLVAMRERYEAMGKILALADAAGCEGNVITLDGGAVVGPMNAGEIGLAHIKAGDISNELLDAALAPLAAKVAACAKAAGEDGRAAAERERERRVNNLVEDLNGEKPIAGDLASHRKEFLALKAAAVEPNSYREWSQFLARLEEMRDAGGRIIPGLVAEISEENIRRAFIWLNGQAISTGRKLKHWRFFKRFIIHLAEEKIIVRPENLTSKKFTFAADEIPEVKTWKDDFVIKVLAELPPKLRLWSLLALNCSMNSIDIGTLEHGQVEGGYLTRRRHKTRKRKNAPTITYKLWPTTLDLLTKYRSEHPMLILTNEEGQALCKAGHNREDGGDGRYNKLGHDWAKIDCPLNLKNFRSIGADALHHSDCLEHRLLVRHYLGRGPKTMEEKHYVSMAPVQERFDLATDWLGRKYGQVK